MSVLTNCNRPTICIN